MNKHKIVRINRTYELLEKLESKENENEISVELLDSCAVIYYSEYFKRFNIILLKKNEVKSDYYLLSTVKENDFINYLNVLCDNFIIKHEL